MQLPRYGRDQAARVLGSRAAFWESRTREDWRGGRRRRRLEAVSGPVLILAVIAGLAALLTPVWRAITGGWPGEGGSEVYIEDPWSSNPFVAFLGTLAYMVGAGLAIAFVSAPLVFLGWGITTGDWGDPISADEARDECPPGEQGRFC
jgi:hypothetical protein